MNEKLVSTTPLENFVNPILGLPAWGVRKGHGSFVTFEFGDPQLQVWERQTDAHGLRRWAFVHGIWHIWIYFCNWRVLQNGTQIGCNENTSKIIVRAVSKLNGQKLMAVNADPANGRSTFDFDLGGSLETWPQQNDQIREQWIIFNGTETFTYRTDGTYMRTRSNAQISDARWLPFK